MRQRPCRGEVCVEYGLQQSGLKVDMRFEKLMRVPWNALGMALIEEAEPELISDPRYLRFIDLVERS